MIEYTGDLEQKLKNISCSKEMKSQILIFINNESSSGRFSRLIYNNNLRDILAYINEKEMFQILKKHNEKRINK